MDTATATTGPTATTIPTAARRTAAHAAAAWGVAFSLVHVYWLLGGRTGLPEGRTIWGNTPLLVIDVLAIPGCAVAAALALALVRPWGARVPRRLLTVGLRGTAVLLLAHSTPSVPDWLALAAGSRTADDLDAMARFATFLYEPFFLAGGVLFTLAALAHRTHRTRR
ncbi:hypothetical protein GCM10010441_43770 [Kitasatospora paracochleata]|uniref:DUF3995 domain-containing protein n=1 Tax=Kitasatospora paracochleata TaxID=58354 RepID=UPI0031E18CEA